MTMPPLQAAMRKLPKYMRDTDDGKRQLAEFAAACRAAALEEASVKCIELMKQYRFDKHTHEGLGDIRLTIGAQEEIAAAIRALAGSENA